MKKLTSIGTKLILLLTLLVVCAGIAIATRGDIATFTNSANVDVVRIDSTGNLFPGTDDARKLGKSDLKWSEIYGVDASLTGNLTVTGTITGGGIDTTYLPSADNTDDLGSAAKEWRNVYMAESIYNTTNEFTFPSAGGVFVTTAGTQTLTNKTLTSPTLTTPALNGTVITSGLTMPAFTAGNVTWAAGTKATRDSGAASATGGAATLSKQAGIITSEALSTAAAGTYTLTLTNTQVAAGSNVRAQATLGTATTGIPYVSKVTPGSGSVVVVVTNIDPSAALNGTILVSFEIVNP